MCPPEAFRRGEEITVTEYWKSQGVLDAGEEEARFIGELSRTVKDWIRDKETTPLLKLYVTIEFLVTLMIFGILGAVKYDLIIDGFGERLRHFGKDHEKIVRLFMEKPVEAIGGILEQIKKVASTMSSTKENEKH